MPGYYTAPPSGGSGFAIGPEINRLADDPGDGGQATPLDLTKATLVTVAFTTNGAGTAELTAWVGNTGQKVSVVSGVGIVLTVLFPPGETYYYSVPGFLTGWWERTVG